MRLPWVVRNALLLAAAAATGWWARGVRVSPVLAQGDGEHGSNRSSGSDGLAFQLSGVNPETALTIWNPSNHTLYIYQGAVMGNSNVNCSFSFHVDRAGAPIQRQNCPIGQLFPSR